MRSTTARPPFPQWLESSLHFPVGTPSRRWTGSIVELYSKRYNSLSWFTKIFESFCEVWLIFVSICIVGFSVGHLDNLTEEVFIGRFPSCTWTLVNKVIKFPLLPEILSMCNNDIRAVWKFCLCPSWRSRVWNCALLQSGDSSKPPRRCLVAALAVCASGSPL